MLKEAARGGRCRTWRRSPHAAQQGAGGAPGVDALADSEVIDALSMLKLGQELNAGAMSLRHFIYLL
jgi:hypothetical protein